MYTVVLYVPLCYVCELGNVCLYVYLLICVLGLLCRFCMDLRMYVALGYVMRVMYV